MLVLENYFPWFLSDFYNYPIDYKCHTWRRGWQRIGSNIFMVNQRTASREPTCSPQDFHGQSKLTHRENLVCKTIMVNQSHLMKSVQLVQSNFSYRIENNWESSSDKTKRDIHACSETQWLPEDTSDTLLYFLTTCTALCRRGTLKWLLMSVIINKRVSR